MECFPFHHDELMRAQIKPEPPLDELKLATDKWILSRVNTLAKRCDREHG